MFNVTATDFGYVSKFNELRYYLSSISTLSSVGKKKHTGGLEVLDYGKVQLFLVKTDIMVNTLITQ